MNDAHDVKTMADGAAVVMGLGGFLGWSATWQILHPEGGGFNHMVKNPEAHHNYKQEEKSFFKKLFGK